MNRKNNDHDILLGRQQRGGKMKIRIFTFEDSNENTNGLLNW